MKTKEILTIELRYKSLNKHKDDTNHRSKTITIGIYDTLKEAIKEGNKVLDNIHHYWDDNKQTLNKMERFNETHFKGYPKRTVSDLGVKHNTGVQMFVRIEKLTFENVEYAVINSIKNAKEAKIFNNSLTE